MKICLPCAVMALLALGVLFRTHVLTDFSIPALLLIGALAVVVRTDMGAR